MREGRVRRSLTRLAKLAALLAVATCTDGGLSPTRTWITPTGLVVSDPPELLVGAGDIGNCNISGDEATALLLDAIPDGTVFTTGDNAYEQGTEAQYTNCYHPNWGRHKARTRPAPGNHEYDSPNAAGYYAYFGAAAGEIGKGYYSYNLGAWHVIVLNSSGGGAGTNVSMSKGSAQEQWLLADLATNQNMCTVAIWHHPLYQSASGSGTGGIIDTKSRAVWEDLYAAGVDLVLHGHRHFYERMAPQRPDQTPDPLYGVRSITVGTGGNGHSSVGPNVAPNSEARSGDTYGVLKVWLYPDSYAWKFVPVAGKTFSDSGSTACHGAPGSGTATVSATLSTLAAEPTSLTAGSGSSTVTVTVNDGSGNPISGANVVLSATGTGNTIVQPSGPSDANGVVSGTLSSTGAGSKTVSATANGVAITQSATVSVTPGPVSGTVSTVTAAPTSIAAGAETSTITVTARDANGNPISGATVVLSATGVGNTLTQPGPTNASGIATGTLGSLVPESKNVTAEVNGTPLSQSAAVLVTIGLPSASQSSVTAAPTTLTAGSGSATINVTVRTSAGTPIPGATVVLAATGSGNTLTQPTGPTDENGVATGALSSTGAGTKTISATANSIALTQTASVTVTPGPLSATASTVGAAPASISAGTGSSTITVTAKDAHGNPISGLTVVLAATGSGNSLTQPSAPTNASGAATGTLSSSVEEAKTVSATAGGLAITQTATVNVIPAGPMVIAAASNVAACGSNVRDEATATLLDAIPGNVLLLGSGAFNNGTATVYTNCYGPTWGRHKARTYPAPGNQDYQTAGATGYFAYFGAQAGDPTKGYYSFDLGDWHVIVLNTGNEGAVSYALGSPQELWLKADLAANTKLCTLAVLNNTRFFSSSTAGWFSSGAAKHLWNDLYAAGADVVLSGRLYHYERMAPQNGNGARDDARGLRQFNVGTGGYTATMPTFIAPNSEAVSAAYGVLRLNLAPDSYGWEFVPIPGSTFTDSGTGTCH